MAKREKKPVQMDAHLGYEKSERSDSDYYRNGYKSKPLSELKQITSFT